LQKKERRPSGDHERHLQHEKRAGVIKP
jgi:hypothetical protein